MKKIKFEVGKELEQVKETLRETESNFQKVFYNAVDAVLLIDKELFIDCNEATVKLLNAKNKSEVLSTHPSEMSPELQPDGRPSFEKANEMIAIAFETGFHRFEWVHTKISGENFPVEVSLTAIEKQGETVLHVLWKDLTEQKEIEENLRRAVNAANRSNQAKSEFLANMSHEIRTPMNAILGFSELLMIDSQDDLVLKYLNQISSSGNTLLKLIDDILDIARVEANKMSFDYQPVELLKFTEDLNGLFSQKTSEKDLAFTISVQQETPSLLLLPEIRFKQVLVNLIGNAIKFTSQGLIEVVFKCVESSKGLAQLLVEVSDTGIGVPLDQREIIFEPFEQVEGQSLDEYGGTGLGLSICKKLLDHMNGEISVVEKTGKGSLFRVTLNDVAMVDGILNDEREININEYVFEPAKVLIVDDMSINRELIYLFLEPLGFSCKEAENGEEAIRICKSWDPDLVLMDMNMPVTNGFSAAKGVREFSQVPIIAITASSMKEQQEIALIVCDDFLSKPISRLSLIEKISKFLKHDEKEPSA